MSIVNKEKSRSKPTILHHIVDFDLTAENIGGAQLFVIELIKNLTSFSMKIGVSSSISNKKNNFLNKSVGFLDTYYSKINTPKILKFSLGKYLFFNSSKEIKNFDIFHYHLVWGLEFLYLKKWIKRIKGPLIISPHGSLNVENMRFFGIFVNLLYKLFYKSLFDKATCFVATSLQEMKDIKKLHPQVAVAYIPLAISDYSKIRNEEDFFGTYSLPKDKKIILYLSRFHPIKGGDVLIKAFKKVSLINNDFILVMAGNDIKNYKSKLVNLVAELNIQNKVFFLPFLNKAEKIAAYNAAYIFVLPSYSESFGLVILEALNQGLPVITTTGTPWEILEKEKCGWQIPLNIEFLTDTLIKAIQIEKEEYKEFQRNAVKISKQFTWNEINNKYFQMYNWCINKNDKYDFIYE